MTPSPEANDSTQHKPSAKKKKAQKILNALMPIIIEAIKKNQKGNWNMAYECAWTLNMLITIEDEI